MGAVWDVLREGHSLARQPKLVVSTHSSDDEKLSNFSKYPKTLSSSPLVVYFASITLHISIACALRRVELKQKCVRKVARGVFHRCHADRIFTSSTFSAPDILATIVQRALGETLK